MFVNKLFLLSGDAMAIAERNFRDDFCMVLCLTGDAFGIGG
jgi:hypothetical protein